MALDAAKECLHLAERKDDNVAAMLAHRLTGTSLFMRGEPVAGRRHLEQALALCDPQHYAVSVWVYGGVDLRTATLVWLSQMLWILGYPDRAWRTAQDGLANAGRQGAFIDLVHAMFQASVTRVLRREFQEVRELADEAVALANRHGLSLWVLYVGQMREWARLGLERDCEAVAQFRQSLTAVRATGNWRVPLSIGAQAEALAVVDRVEEALEAIAEALALTEESEERWSEAELHRLKGEILLMQGGRGAASFAEACFVRAIEIAQSHEARSWELRASTSLARLWQSQDKRQEAHDLLAPVYGWFTEGFDTADLKDAKALLDEFA